MLKRKLALILISCILIVQSAELDRIFTPQRSFYSSAFKSLGDAGIALPLDISGGLLNPALVFSYRKQIQEVHGSISAGYGRDSIYNRHIMPVGVSYANAEGAIAGFYRLLMNDRELVQHEIAFNISGQMFQNAEQQGPVDFGMNIRYEKMDWKKRPLGALPITRYSSDSLGGWNFPTIIDTNDTSVLGEISENRVLMDIGFYQSDVWPHVDFGLTMRNLLGYVWTREKPDTGHIDSVSWLDSTQSDSVMTRTSVYKDKMQKSGEWISGRHRTLAAGIVYRVEMAGGNLRLSLPLDIEILGLFDKKVKNRFMFRGGIQAGVSQHFFARFGYSRAPGPIEAAHKELKNINIFTGGAGIAIAPVTLDFYVSKDTFGTTASFNY